MSTTTITASANKQKTVEIAANLWQITNNLKGKVDAKTFSKYVLALFFFRFLSENLENYLSQQETGEDEGVIGLKVIFKKGFYICPSKFFSRILIKAKEEPFLLLSYRFNLVNLVRAIFNSPQDPNHSFGFYIFREKEAEFPELFREIHKGKNLKFEELGETPQERSKKIFETMEAINQIPILDLVKKTYESNIDEIIEIQKEIEEVYKKGL